MALARITSGILLAHDFNVDMLPDLVRDGLATAHRETTADRDNDGTRGEQELRSRAGQTLLRLLQSPPLGLAFDGLRGEHRGC
jgi:hypothetical protein